MVEIKDIVRTNKFEKEIRSVRGSDWKEKIKKKIKGIIENPAVGKPLRYDLHGERSVRIGPYRLIYSVKNSTLFLLRFDHRKEVYK